MNKLHSPYWNTFHKWKVLGLKFLDQKKFLILILIFSYCFSDLIIISLHSLFLSNKVTYTPALNRSKSQSSVEEYIPIWDFNIFHNQAIPASFSTLNTSQTDQNSIPVLSLLPLQLNGTIVYRNPTYSMAHITVKNKNISESYQIEDSIESLARITSITSDRVYFININSHKKEYIEVPNLHNINFEFKKKSSVISSIENQNGKDVKQLGNFKFEVSRSDINKKLRNLPSILQDAKVVPHWVKGKMIGFRFKYIKKGSIYEQFKFKKSDIIMSVSGEQLRSQLQAAELFHLLKTRSHLDMMVKRKGKNIAFSLDVKEDVSMEEAPKSRFY